ncbi:hypothetical protein Tco_1306161, partial [Tanacetum coccineum]
TIMSDSEDSTVTYTVVSSPFGGLSDIGSLGVVGLEHEGLPWMLDDPYVQVALQALHHQTTYLAPRSHSYILESDPKEDLEEDDDEDPEEDPADYPADGGDDGDDECNIQQISKF